MHINDIFLAGTDVWPGFIDQLLNLGFLTELSGNVVKSSEKSPNVDETTDGCASEGIHSPLHVVGQTVRHNDNQQVLKTG